MESAGTILYNLFTGVKGCHALLRRARNDGELTWWLGVKDCHALLRRARNDVQVMGFQGGCQPESN